MSTPGYSGSSYDRHVDNSSNDTSTLHRMKETYWTTKQAVIQKLGKKEDHHVVASDAQLDAKLEVFKAIQESTMTLLEVIERYQNRLCVAAQEESAMGRYLKSNCSHNKTRAGKMMAAVGKSQSLSAQERLTLRVPLVRLYQEVETFRYRAISDTLINVHRMEGGRTEYRGALLWMKKVSEDLDPDTYKQLEKFRKVQTLVRKSKQRFDRLKLDVMQKVDLLAASRCNMFSQVLAAYQSTLLHFWHNTARTMAVVAEEFKGYQYYEFNMLRELTETSRKLAEESNALAAAERTQDSSDTEEVSDEELIDISDDPQKWGKDDSADNQPEARGSPKQQAQGLLWREEEGRGREKDTHLDREQEEWRKASAEEGRSGEEFGPFMGFEDDDLMMPGMETELQRTQSLMRNVKSPMDLQQRGQLAEGNKDPPKTGGRERDQTTTTSAIISGGDLDPEDDLSLLNLILNAPSTGEDEFTQEWQTAFGTAPMQVTPHTVPAERDPSQPGQAEFMPSCLMDTQSAFSLFTQRHGGGEGSGVGMVEGLMGESSPLQPPSSAPVTSLQPLLETSQEQKKNMSEWISLFADLDPLSNPDAVGRRESEDVSGNL